MKIWFAKDSNPKGEDRDWHAVWNGDDDMLATDQKIGGELDQFASLHFKALKRYRELEVQIERGDSTVSLADVALARREKELAEDAFRAYVEAHMDIAIVAPEDEGIVTDVLGHLRMSTLSGVVGMHALEKGSEQTEGCADGS